MSHRVGASCVHHIDTGSNSVPVLGLRSLSKCSWVYQVQLSPTGYSHTFELGGGHPGEGGHQSLLGPNRPIFVHGKGGHCSSWVCEEIMALNLEQHNSVCPRFWQEEIELSRVGLPGVERMGLVGLLLDGGAAQPSGKVVVWPTPQSHTT